MNKIRLLALLAVVFLFVGACESEEDIFEDQKIEIQEFLIEKGWTADTTLPSGVVAIIDDLGTGSTFPEASSNVTVHYEGRLLDNTKFDSSFDRGQPFTSNLQNLIMGWQLGIPLFKKGGKGKLIIPSRLGYGSTARTGIPANSVLVFDIELVDFD
jgi:FKBP-type peptidyl-prolyl cis-trans isomerase